MKKVLAAILVLALAAATVCAYAETYTFTYYMATDEENNEITDQVPEYEGAQMVIDTEAMSVQITCGDSDETETVTDVRSSSDETDESIYIITDSKVIMVGSLNSGMFAMYQDGEVYCWYLS